MDYPKRNQLRSEIDILIERLSILQEQEKSYEDLEIKINKKRGVLVGLTDEQTLLSSTITNKRIELDKLGVEIKDGKGELKTIDKERDKFRLGIKNEQAIFDKQRLINDSYVNKIRLSIDNYIAKESQAKEDSKKALQKYEDNLLLINEKQDILDEVMKNEEVISDQNEKMEAKKAQYAELCGEYKEMDKSYQLLLENYILIQ